MLTKVSNYFGIEQLPTPLDDAFDRPLLPRISLCDLDVPPFQLEDVRVCGPGYN